MNSCPLSENIEQIEEMTILVEKIHKLQTYMQETNERQHTVLLALISLALISLALISLALISLVIKKNALDKKMKSNIRVESVGCF